MPEDNILLMTDSYKVSHARQYPPKTSRVFSFFESRGGVYPEVVFFGLQYIIKRYLVGRVVTKQKIHEARDLLKQHLDQDLMNLQDWQYINRVHGGRLPVRISAVLEGSVLPTRNVLMTVENTDDEVPWLTNYLETILSQVWYPSTVATQSREMKKTIADALTKTGGNPDILGFKLHDFGYRGSTSHESAGIGGLAHLVNFFGTDTLAALTTARDYYGAACAGFSIPAAEHSTITSWGKDHEVDAYRNMLEQFPTGTVAVVSDSYDVYRACDELWGGHLRDAIQKRQGTLVIRPDSGYPPDVVVKVLDILGTRFGFEINEAGFKVLPSYIRVIQGDGIDHVMIERIYDAMAKTFWSADNIAFGSGGGLLQKVNRDTQKFAFKCSAAKVDGQWRDVFKDPVTDPGKTSKAGRLKLILQEGEYRTVREEDAEEPSLLVPVFLNGELVTEQTLTQIRHRARL